jgi:hypothetical protein
MNDVALASGLVASGATNAANCSVRRQDSRTLGAPVGMLESRK